MTRITIQQFINGKPQFNCLPRHYQEAIEMEVAGFDLIIIHKIAENTFNVYGVSRDYEGEVIVL